MIGYAFMGAAHSQGWRTAPRVFDLPLAPDGLQVQRVLAAVEASSLSGRWESVPQ